MNSLFTGLITSKIRVNIIMRLFMNPTQHAYLRELADEFNASPSHIKEELHQLKSANLLKSKKKGRQILFSANAKHPIFKELHSMVRKTLGMDQILESMITRLGNLEKAILVDDYAEGKDTGIIDLILVGEINKDSLLYLTEKTEKYINRKIRTLVFTSREYKNFEEMFLTRPSVLLWRMED